MKKSNEEPETTSTLKRQIDDLKARQSKDMESLYAYYAQLYRQEQEDLRRSWDDSVSQDLDDPAFLAASIALDASPSFFIGIYSYLSSPYLQEFYKNCRLPINYQLELDDAVSRIRYSHLQTLLALQRKLAMLSAQFPESIDTYHAMTNNQDMQLKVAKFLTAPGNMRDAMLSDFGWAWRQVKPLMNVFERDVSVSNLGFFISVVLLIPILFVEFVTSKLISFCL
jgi:hypothetical protein